MGVEQSIEHWLAEIGLDQYAEVLSDNAVDFDVLSELTEQDLRELGIPLGHRKKFLRAIALLSNRPRHLNDTPLENSAPQIRSEGERRQLTVMFCDLVGSTALASRFDPEDFREIVRSFQAACTRAIAQYEGYVAKYLGDAVLVYFGFPIAHDNDAERAARAGLDIVKGVRDIQTKIPSIHDVELAVRIGINTGLVIVGDIIGEGASEQASVIGETPNIAARLQEMARPNEIVIGPLTRGLIGDGFACDSLGPKAIRGVSDPVQVWHLLGVLDVAEIPENDGESVLLPLVGRPEELGLLLRSWDASKKGFGHVVLVQGEAGIGKSRLVEEMRAKLASESLIWVAIRCSPYHANTTLYPVIEHLKRAIGWRADDDDERKLAKLEAALEAQPLGLERAVPLFSDLLALPNSRYTPLKLSAQEQREQTLDALVGWIIDTAERKPVLQTWEDLHWADQTTLELLGLLIGQSPTVPIMNVLTYRPDFTVPWTMRSHMLLITLSRLDQTEVEGLILQRTSGKAMPQEVVEYIARKTDGVPLYVEELLRTLVEAGFVHETGDRYELKKALSDVAIPATLQDLLMARLDRLPTIREVAQLGSILGREFAYDMLQAIASLEKTTLENGLDQLVNAELLYQRGRRPRARYVFKHALVQDAAYQSLLKRTRQFYHRQVAEVLESQYPEIVQTQPELLAQHYSKAEDDDKALKYYSAVAENSAAMSAHTEAVAALNKARCHAERLPSNELLLLRLAVRQAQPLHFLGRRQEIIELLSRHQNHVDQVIDHSLIAEYYFWLGFAHAWLGHREEAIVHLKRSLTKAGVVNDLAIAGRVHRALATEYVYSGRPLQDAIAHGRQAVSFLEQTDDRFWLSQALFTLSYCCIFAGDFYSGLEAASQLNAFGDAAGIRRAQANAAMLAGLAHALSGEGEKAVELCQRALDLSPDDFETAFILACLGRSYLEAGNKSSAVSMLEKAVALADKVRSVQFRAWFRTMLGEAFLASNSLEEAAIVARQALATSTEIQFAVGIGLSYQLLGRIDFASGNRAEALHNLQAAVDHLTSVGALFELARTHLVIAELARAKHDQPTVALQLQKARELCAELNLPREPKLHGP